MRDLLDQAYRSSDAEWVTYTNVDISLMPTFYKRVVQLIEEGNDTIVINRRTIPKKWSSVAELEHMYKEKGDFHLGYDCFVFPRNWIPSLDLGDVCIGAPYVGLALMLALFVKANSLKLVQYEHLTFHLGDDRDWNNSKSLDFAYFNEDQVRGLINRLESQHGLFDESLPSWSYFLVDDIKNNRRKIGVHPPLIRFSKILVSLIKRTIKKIRDFRYRDLLWELSLFVIAGFAKQPKNKFIIYGSARTGTTICLSLLSKHPNLVAEHEIFNQYHAKSKKDFDQIYSEIGVSHTPPLFFKNSSIEHVAATKCKKAKRDFYCFKLLSGQMTPEEEGKFVHKRIKLGWKIIFVSRENILATAISYYIAFANFDKSASWFGAKSKRMHIDAQGLINYLDRFETELLQQQNILKDQPHLGLIYEEDYLDSNKHQSVCDKAFEFLGMDSCVVSSTMKKQGAKVVSDRVENWEELRTVLEETRFRKYL
ncbi:hypothetical protein F7C95_18885 [Opitutia bacterium ISCC 51]|nr:hypothetical protein F7C95_18885 [Opitutae bacterium ISCC 51]QXD28026.1 hypothetical protein GA003_18790 [Opitutae bacterium ISCC 52]